MTAFVHALNDSDERVREKAADEIGDQVRRNRCIVGSPVIRALRCSLADCDRGVRRQAEQSLKECGFKIVDGYCSDTASGGYCPAEMGVAHDVQGVSSESEISLPVSDNDAPALQSIDTPVPAVPDPTPDLAPNELSPTEPDQATDADEKARQYEADPELAPPPASTPIPAPAPEPTTAHRTRLNDLFRSPTRTLTPTHFTISNNQ